MNKLKFWAISLASTLILSTSILYGDGSRHAIEQRYPVGSSTFAIVSSNGGIDVIQLATPSQTRKTARLAKELEPTQRMDLLTLTVWSDGDLVPSEPTKATDQAFDRILDRLTSEPIPTLTGPTRTPTPPPPPAPTATEPKYEHGEQCHAKTGDGKRCSRLAKGETGFCFQHQQSPDAFPD